MISDSFSFQTRLVDPYVKQLIQMHKRIDFVLRFTHRLQSYIIR